MLTYCQPAKWLGSEWAIETVSVFSQPEPLPAGSPRTSVVASYLGKSGIIPAMVTAVNMHRFPGYSPDDQALVYDKSSGFRGERLGQATLIGSRDGKYYFELEAKEEIPGSAISGPVYTPLIDRPGHYGNYPSALVVAADGSQKIFGQLRDDRGILSIGGPGEGDPEILVSAMRLFAADLIKFVDGEHVC